MAVRYAGTNRGEPGLAAAAAATAGQPASPAAAEIYELPAVERLVYQMTALTSAVTDKFPAVSCQGVRLSQEGAVDTLL